MIKEKLACAPVFVTEEKTWAAAEDIMKITGSKSPLRESLNIIRYNGHYLKQTVRSLKTHYHCQVHAYKPTTIVPEIVLCGKWLQRAGFDTGDSLWVLPFSELLIVIPQGAESLPKGKRET